MDSKQSSSDMEVTLRRAALLLVLFFIPVLFSMSPRAITDADIWWHLRTGQWIVQHHTVPLTDPFSAFGTGNPWVAYSWLFEIIVYGLYHAFGLLGIVIYQLAVLLTLALALYNLLRKLTPSFTVAIALSYLGMFAMSYIAMPRPWLFTIIFFIVELDILLDAARTGSTRRLWFLPILFALWANIHIQFLYGLFALALLAAEPVLNRMLRRPVATGRTLPLWGVFAASVAATLVNPYHVRIYGVIYEYMTQSAPFKLVSELQALEFRHPLDFLVLLIALGGAFAIGRKPNISAFMKVLFVCSAIVSFRSGRDLWFVVIVALGLIAESVVPRIQPRFAPTKLQIALLILVLGIGIATVAKALNLTNSKLESTVRNTFPDAAARFVESRHFPGPLYNHFNWGGYLIWRLPGYRVAMDGRTNLHGDQRLLRSNSTWSAEPDWASDPELSAARLVIANVKVPLFSCLVTDQRFQLVYRDDIAAVFVRRESFSATSAVAPVFWCEVEGRTCFAARIDPSRNQLKVCTWTIINRVGVTSEWHPKQACV